MSSNQQQTGVVKFFNTERGYGFVKCDDGNEYFVHHSGVSSKEVKEGDSVKFELQEGRKGLNAVNVTVV